MKEKLSDVILRILKTSGPLTARNLFLKVKMERPETKPVGFGLAMTYLQRRKRKVERKTIERKVRTQLFRLTKKGEKQ